MTTYAQRIKSTIAYVPTSAQVNGVNKKATGVQKISIKPIVKENSQP